jgi:histidine ammonia-lyase
MSKYVIDNHWVSLEEIQQILDENKILELSSETAASIQKCRTYLDQRMESGTDIIYGINTGFGSLCDTIIPASDLNQLQKNLVLSHACGTGAEIDKGIVRRILLLKILGLSKGNSGVQLETVQRLIFFFNERVYPIIYSQGSLGASGDLAPLAHLSLPLIGEGEVWYNGQKQPTDEVLKLFGLKPIELKSKEGLALLNGTQFMSAFASHAVYSAKQLIKNYSLISAMSLEGFDGRLNPFQENVNAIRNQQGQIQIAEQMREILQGSELISREKKHVQDPYSFRCIPQVHGASLDAIEYVEKIVEREVNAVTDNPTIFPDEDDVVSAGNFHGQPLAISMDFLAIALAELGSISERRIYKLISGTRALPAFLVAEPGLNSGFMIPQYTAASIVSQNKQLCTPASIDTIDSSNGQEDHVSMGANAATKLYQVVENVFQIQGIELFAASQALEFRRPLKSSEKVETLFNEYRKHISFVKTDLYMSELMRKSMHFVKKLR